MNWFIKALKKYAVFEGRARRKEYWFFMLFYLIIFFVLVLIDVVTGNINEETGLGLISGIFILAMILPSISVGIRRLHDTDRSGWWWWILLIPLIGEVVIFVFMVLDGTSGQNKYGSDPKA